MVLTVEFTGKKEKYLRYAATISFGAGGFYIGFGSNPQKAIKRACKRIEEAAMEEWRRQEHAREELT